MSTDDDRTTATVNGAVAIVGIPDGAMATDAIVVVAYVDSEGQMGFRVLADGSGSSVSGVGLLEVAKKQLIDQSFGTTTGGGVMGDGSAIEWTDATWNPLVGCERVSEGCDHCYAIGVVGRQMSAQHKGLTVRLPSGLDWNGQVNVAEHLLRRPSTWRRPRRIFMNSLSDPGYVEALGKRVPFPEVADGWAFLVTALVAEMVLADWHVFQVLTKRPKALADLLAQPAFRHDVDQLLLARGHEGLLGHDQPGWRWPAHIIWVTSIELDKYSFRADHIRRIAGTTGISAEPLLGPLPSLDLTGIDWLIVGGESGRDTKRRPIVPLHPQWVRELRDRATLPPDSACDCSVPAFEGAGQHSPRCGVFSWRPTAFHFKQWGEYVSYTHGGSGVPNDSALLAAGHQRRTVLVDGTVLGEDDDALLYLDPSLMLRVGKHAAGRQLDGRTWDEQPTITRAGAR